MPKRIRYVPGLVSLALLVPVCVVWLNAHHAFEQQRCFSLIFKAPPYTNSDDALLPPPPDPSEADVRWSHFTMDGRLGLNQNVLKAFQNSLREVENSENKYAGLHVHFGKNATYATVMAAIEICRNTVNGYSINDHDLWAVYVPTPVRSTNPNLLGQAFECLLCDDLEQIPHPTTGRR